MNIPHEKFQLQRSDSGESLGRRTKPWKETRRGHENNLLGGGNQQHSFIGSGIDNTITGMCSAILGGEGNTVTHCYAAAFGFGLNSVADNTFHVSCLNALNTPLAYSAALPTGTIFADAGTPPAACARPLYIRL